MLFDSGIFDQEPIEDLLQYYTLDTILEIIAKPASYQMATTLGNVNAAPYHITTSIQRPFAQYLLDCILTMDKSDPRLVESIINAILWSYGRAFEDLSQAISMMGLRLLLPYAIPEDLDMYWSRILGLKRRYGESDEDFRERLATRLAIMKSSGTKPECEAILDHILSLPGASRLETYPGEVLVCWNSYTAMRMAQAKYPAIKEALDDMIAAGISWITFFPWTAMQIDTNLFGPQHTSFEIATDLSGRKYQLYLLRTDLFNQGSLSEDIDACLEEGHQTFHRIDARLFAQRSKSQPINVTMVDEVSVLQQCDAYLHQIRSRESRYDMLAEKGKPKVYKADWLAERRRQHFYLISTELVAS